jgi:hypothetical protein
MEIGGLALINLVTRCDLDEWEDLVLHACMNECIDVYMHMHDA